MTGPVRPRTRALALRGQERREIARRAPTNRGEAVRRALTHLREARLELLAAGRLTVAAELDGIRKRIEEDDPR